VNQTFTPLQDDDDEEFPHSEPSEHYHISNSCKVYFNITKWLVDNKKDQAVKVYLSVSYFYFRHFLTLSQLELSSNFEGPFTGAN
jgi:hypothetical protein